MNLTLESPFKVEAKVLKWPAWHLLINTLKHINTLNSSNWYIIELNRSRSSFHRVLLDFLVIRGQLDKAQFHSNLMVHGPWTIRKVFPVRTNFRTMILIRLLNIIYFWNHKILIQRISLTDQTWRNTIRIWKLRA